MHLSRDTICLTSQAQTKHKRQLFTKESLWEPLGRQCRARGWTPGSVLSPAAEELGEQLWIPTWVSYKWEREPSGLPGVAVEIRLASCVRRKLVSSAFDESLPLERASLVASISGTEYHTEMSIFACVSLRTCREFSPGRIPRRVPQHCWAVLRSAVLVCSVPSEAQGCLPGPH